MLDLEGYVYGSEVMARQDEKRQITVELDLEQYRTLWRLAYIDGYMPEEVARRVLTQYLEWNQERSLSRIRFPKPMTEEERKQSWAEFEVLLERMRAAADEDDGSVDIEAEITLAVEEVRREQASRRRVAGG